MSEKKLTALFDAVIVKAIEEEESRYGNIVVPDLGKESSKSYEVISVGPGTYSVTGETFVKTSLNEGDIVVLPTMGWTKFEFKGDEFLIGSERTVLAKINQ
jgi:chaperonin GroES